MMTSAVQIEMPARTSARKPAFPLIVALAWVSLSVAFSVPVAAQNQGTESGAAAKSRVRAVGTVKAIAGDTITLIPDSGSEVVITIQPMTRLVRTLPGQTDLKTATPVQIQDVQVGDRLLVGGTREEDGKSIVATTAIVMKKADISQKQEQEREDWQKRGVGGVVKKIDPATDTITIAAGALGNDMVTVKVSKDTMLRRYAPDSIKFDDAKPGTLEQVKVGDQLRARGTRSPDGKELAAEEIVSGTFRNVAGTVVAADAGNGTITVSDLATKRPVTMKVGSDSQLHKLPQMVATRIAMTLKSGSSNGPPAEANPQASRAQTAGGSSGAGARPGGPPDFQRMLNRMPPVTLAELQKGDALMIVATEGSESSPSTVIILLSGVEPILTAAPTQASTILSPWNLGGGAAAAGAGDTP